VTDGKMWQAESSSYLEPSSNLGLARSEGAQQIPSSSDDHCLQRTSEECLTNSGDLEKSRTTASLVASARKVGVFQSESDRIQEALDAIPADLPREKWIRVGMALKSRYGDGGFDLFDSWSKQGENYDERNAKDAYKSFKDGKGISIATLFYIAQQYGYGHHETTLRRHPISKFSDMPSRIKDAVDASQADREMQAVTAMKRGEKLLRRLPDAIADTPYLKKKGLIPAPGMKETPDGKLVVPVYGADGNLCTLQFIEGDGNKRFQRGGKTSGGFLLLGELSNEVLVCEGVATGLTLALTGHGRVAVAFSKGNLKAVAETLRTRYPTARMTICADNDRHGPHNGGVEVATQVATEMNALLAIPSFESADGSDFDDLRQQKGIDEVTRQLAQASLPNPLLPQISHKGAVAAMSGRFQILTAEDLRVTKPLGWRVAGIFPLTGLGAIYGPSSSGKSFLALDMAAAIAEGVPTWFGRRITQSPVTYVALEGESGMSKRIEAWAGHNGKRPSTQLRFITERLNLRDAADIEELGTTIVKHGGRNGVTIIDTLNRAAGGADENSSSHMGELIAGADRLKEITAGLVIIVHHTGKNQQAGLRGHSSLYAALDGAIEVSRDSQSRQWEVSKSKDDADGQPYTFELQSVTIGKDDFGEVITSCVVVDASTSSPRRKRLVGGSQRIAAEVLAECMRDGELGREGAPPNIPSVDFERAVHLVAERLTCPSNKKVYNARKVIESMISSGYYSLCSNRLWSTDLVPEK
jgi:hypothetical protein